MTTIRPATAADLEAIGAIYAHWVRSGVATFDLEPPPVSYWQARLDSAEPGDHLLVAEGPDHAVQGYAYSAAYRARPAYRYTRETSVHLAADALGRGVGSALYGSLLPLLAADGMHTAVAVIAQPNPGSDALHRASGFRHVGTLSEVGFKHDRWIDTAWWQKRLT